MMERLERDFDGAEKASHAETPAEELGEHVRRHLGEAPALAGGSAPAITPPGTKALTKAQKLAKALKACHKRFGAHPPKQRTRCEVAARKQFGSKRRKK